MLLPIFILLATVTATPSPAPSLTPTPTATPTPIPLPPGNYSLSGGHYQLNFKPGAVVVPDQPVPRPNAYAIPST